MTAEWRGPFWLKPFFRDKEDTIFHRVTAVKLDRRVVPESLGKLQYLETVQLQGCRIPQPLVNRLNQRDHMRSLVPNPLRCEQAWINGIVVQPQPSRAQQPATSVNARVVAGALRSGVFIGPHAGFRMSDRNRDEVISAG